MVTRRAVGSGGSGLGRANPPSETKARRAPFNGAGTSRNKLSQPLADAAVGRATTLPQGPQKVRKQFPRCGQLLLSIWRAYKELRKGPCFPSFLEPRRTAEKALVAVIQEAYVQGVSTRPVDALVQAMGGSGVSKSQVSRLCGGIDERVQAVMQDDGNLCVYKHGSPSSLCLTIFEAPIVDVEGASVRSWAKNHQHDASPAGGEEFSFCELKPFVAVDYPWDPEGLIAVIHRESDALIRELRRDSQGRLPGKIRAVGAGHRGRSQ